MLGCHLKAVEAAGIDDQLGWHARAEQSSTIFLVFVDKQINRANGDKGSRQADQARQDLFASVRVNMPCIVGRLPSERAMGGKLFASASSSGSTRWRVEMGNSPYVQCRADLFGRSAQRLPFRAIGTSLPAQPSLPPCSNACESGTNAGDRGRKTVPHQCSRLARSIWSARLPGAAG